MTEAGEWREARLYVLKSIEDLQRDVRDMQSAAAVDREVLVAKASKDIAAAHEKIRVLESSAGTLRLKNWIMSLALAAAGAVTFEFVKEFIHHMVSK